MADATATSDDGFTVGERIEFRSGFNGGCWLPGTVVLITGAFDPRFENDDRKRGGGASGFVRIDVGNGVCVVRKVSKCRRAEGEIADRFST